MNLPKQLTVGAYGVIHFVGHRITLEDVLFRHEEGWSIPQILEEYPTICWEQVEAALELLKSQPEEVRAYLKDTRAKIEAKPQGSRKGPDTGGVEGALGKENGRPVPGKSDLIQGSPRPPG